MNISGDISEKQYDTDVFIKDLHELGIALTEGQIRQFIQYYELLVKWNQVMNLTAITEYSEVMKKHFVDSLSLAGSYDFSRPITLIDVGTGAGFPGLALKIAYPHIRVTLLDSLNKRIQFLDEVTGKLALEGVETVHGRAEDYARPGKLRESFDICVSRAVANLSTLSEYCLPFVKKEGIFVSYKSEKAGEEIMSAQKAVALLGGRLERQVDFALPGSDIHRSLVFIKKMKNTPQKYPRKAGLPGREPL